MTTIPSPSLISKILLCFNHPNLTEMKKILYALLAVAATLSFASCENGFNEDNNPELPVIGSNTLAFTLDRSDVQTRSASESPVISRQMIPMGDPVNGFNFFLEETVTRLGASYEPETKGTPVYTENFHDMFGGEFYGLAKSPTGANAIVDGAFTRDENGVWKREFTSSPFANNDELYFFMRAPQNASGVTNLAYSVSNGNGVIDFDYTSSESASTQQDIVFAARSVTKEEAKAYIPVLFQHALTGVKFAIANVNSDDVKTYITSVKLSGSLYKSAHFTMTPAQEAGKWVDAPGTHSSGATISLSSTETLGADESYSQTYGQDNVVDFDGSKFANKGDYPNSFSAAGNVKNLNDADASLTFWFIPQAIPEDVVMEITFKVLTGTETFAAAETVTRSVNIGQALKTASVNWQAGEIRTYQLRADLIDVDITDEVDGFTKTNVVITNTGNIDAYVRATIVADWWGKNDTNDDGIALGYLGYIDDENKPAPIKPLTFVEPWEMNADRSGDNFGGTFSGWGDNWVLAADGFFYYTNKVEPGKPTEDDLFETYVLDTTTGGIIPKIMYLSTTGGYKFFSDIRLVMELSVQAVEVDADDPDNYKAAWAAAGVTVDTD